MGVHGDRYVREALLAAGGMGRVFLAEDRRLGRYVAVKVAQEGPRAAAALRHEARVVAGLEHPGIVAVHDVGEGEDGRPWVAMRLVRGRTLEDAVVERGSLADRLTLLTHFRDACQAVAYAHSQGVLHRDLKPANVLVGAFGETQVVDWGLAVDADAARAEVVGSPAWMAPEQARGEAADRRTDVWGLGAVLHFVLSGRSLREGDDTDALLALARWAPPPSLPEVVAGVPAELAAVVRRALTLDPADRYPNAYALAEDVERYLTGARVEAHPYGPLELLGRFVRAWRAPLTVAGVALGLSLVGALVAARRLADERDRAVAAEVRAGEELAGALASQARQAVASGATAAGGLLGARALAFGEHPDARGAVIAADAAWPVVRVASWPSGGCPEGRLLADGWACHGTGGLVVVGPEGARWRATIDPVSVEPSGSRLAVQHPSEVRVFDAATGAEVARHPRKSPLPLLGTHDGRFASRRWEGVAWWGGLAPEEQRPLDGCDGHGLPREAAIHPTRALHAAWCADGTVAVTGEEGVALRTDLGLPVREHGDVAALRWSVDGTHLALVWYRGTVGWMDVAAQSLTSATSPRGPGVADVAPSPDGRLLALRRDDGGVELWSTAPLAPVGTLPGEGALDLRWMGDTVVRTLTPTDVVDWRVTPGSAPPALSVGLGVSTLAFSPSGETLVSGHSDGLVVLTRLREGAASGRHVVGRGVVMGASYTPDGRAIVTVPGEEGVVRTLEPASGALSQRAAGMGSRSVLVRGDGALVSLAYEGGVHLYDGVSDWQALPCGPQEWRTWSRGRGDALLLVSVLGEVVPFDGRACGAPVPGLTAERAALAPEGAWLVAWVAEALVRTDLDGVVQWRAPLSDRGGGPLVLSPDGRWVAVGSRERVVRLFDARDGREVAVLRGHDHRVSALAFSPDGSLLASGGWDGRVRLWKTELLTASAEAIEARWEGWGWSGSGE